MFERVEIFGIFWFWVCFDNGVVVKCEYFGVFFFVRFFVEFLGYYVVEGFVNGYQICLVQNWGFFLDCMVEMIWEMGLFVYFFEIGNGVVCIQCMVLWDFLVDFGYFYEKFVFEMVYGWDSEVIWIFLNVVIEGDGIMYKQSGYQVIYIVLKKLVDDFQVLVIKVGWLVNIWIDDWIGFECVMLGGQWFYNKWVSYIVLILINYFNLFVNYNWKNLSWYWNDEGYNDQVEYYVGKIYCVKVFNGFLWVCRNGKLVVFGNMYEQVRYWVGMVIFQEFLWFVCLDDLSFWFLDWVKEDDELYEKVLCLIGQMEDFQMWMVEYFGFDDDGCIFVYKKVCIFFMCCFVLEGLVIGMVWSVNIWILWYIIEMRMVEGVEEEIWIVFDKIGQIMCQECLLFFGDYEVNDVGVWILGWRKV